MALYRRRYNYNTPAPLRGSVTATANLDGIAVFTDLEVEEVSGDLLQPERVFFLTVSTVLLFGSSALRHRFRPFDRILLFQLQINPACLYAFS